MQERIFGFPKMQGFQLCGFRFLCFATGENRGIIILQTEFERPEGGVTVRKGPGILKKVFQRVVMVSISILAQIVVFALVIWKFQDNSEIIYVILLVVSMAAALAIISKNTNPAYKIAWLVPILLFPVFGGLFYLMLGGNRLSRRQTRRQRRGCGRGVLPQPCSRHT